MKTRSSGAVSFLQGGLRILHIAISKNVASIELCGKNLDNSDLIDKITLTLTRNMYYLCTCGCPAGRAGF